MLTEIDGPRDDVNDITTLTYDKKKRLSIFTTPDGRRLRITAYDRYGRPTDIRQGKQQPVVMAYNHRGDVTDVTRRGQALHYQYDAAGQLIKVTGPDGETLTLTYDEAGRATEVLGPDGRQIISELDSEGRTTGNQLLSGQGDVLAQLSYFYDAEGRLNQIQKNGETAQTREYDGDKVTRIADAQGNTTGFDYSSLGELLAITQPDGNATRLAYDAKQNLSAVTDARNNQTQYRYNDFGQLIEQHNPDTGITRYAYDAAGNQTEKTDAAGHKTNYTYDAANRVTQRHDHDGITRYQYDTATGRLSQVIDKSSTETFAYNRDAQLIEHTRTIDKLSFTTTYAYTTQGKLVRKALPDGQLLKYHYHDDGPRKGTLRAITRDDLIGQTTIIGELNTHDSATQTHWQHGNGVAVNKQTDGLGNPVAYSFSKALSLTYSYDHAGRINGIERNGQLNWYDYDSSGQLIGADTSLGRFEYDYDEVGNRTQKTHTKEGRIEQTNYNFAESGMGNRLLNVNGEARDYNAQGNPTETEKLRYAYNVQQRPVKVFEKDTKKLIAEYTYNSFGARIKKVAYSSNAKKKKTVTYYLYDGRKLAAEVNQDGNVTAQYVCYKDQPVAKLQRRAIYAIHADHLGTPQTVTDKGQAVVWQAEYTPFGEATLEEEKIALNLRLPGQYFDEETGTHYNYYRDYDPNTGRYQQSDPIGLLGGPNTYAYVMNNPLQLTDVLGLAPGDPIGPGSEPVSPEAEESYGSKLDDVFDRAVNTLKNNHGDQLMQQVLTDLKSAAPLIIGAVVGAGALAAAASITGIGALISAGTLAAAGATLSFLGLLAVGFDGLSFIYDVIKIGIEIARTDADDCAELDALGNRLAQRILALESGTIQGLATFGIGRLINKVGSVFRRPAGGMCSFSGDTLVLSRDGYTMIRDIEAGNDEVWARDEATNDMGWQPVEAQYSNTYDVTVDITIRTANGIEHTIHSNTIHPFFARTPANDPVRGSSEGHHYEGTISHGAWIDAENLKPGYRLLAANDSWEEVVSVETRDETLQAYNLTVKDYSTYFVAGSEDAEPVWVHNKCYDTLPEGSRSTGTNDLGQDTFVTPDGRAVYRGDDRRFYDIAPRPKVISSRSDFDARFNPSLFPSQAHADDAWSAYRATSTDSLPIVIGRLPDTGAGEALGFQRLNARNWSPQVNIAWMQGGIDAQRNFYLGSNANISNYRAAGIFDSKGNFLGRGEFPDTVFFSEMRQLRDAGYRLDGNYMRPPILEL